jgi:hypothetical protein
MDWIKKHVDTVMVLGGILGATMWMNSAFNSFERRMSVIEKDLAVIKAVLLMRGILPNELVCHDVSKTPCAKDSTQIP